MTELWDRRIPSAENCVLAPLLERRAREMPDKVFVVFEDDETWTYAQMLRHVRRAALGLQRLGVRLEVTEAIPKSASGKILRRVLRDAATAQADPPAR